MGVEAYAIDYTDYSFQKLCENKYGINRGVYNVIDNWFYEQSIIRVQERRSLILSFLHYVTSNSKKIKFGKGGLRHKLEEYWKFAEVNQCLSII